MSFSDERQPIQPRTYPTTPILLCLLMLLLAMALTGCKKDPNVEFIQGLWYYKDAHLANIPAESAQTTNWEFYNWTFTLDTCCFYEAYYSGYYRILESKDNKLTLELYHLQGTIGGTVLHRDDPMTIVIKIDPEADTIRITGDGPYTRVGP
jgi:hypothetical protein